MTDPASSDPGPAQAEKDAASALAGAPSHSTSPSPVHAGRLNRLLTSRKSLVVLYLVFLAAYLAASGTRLRRHSAYNHFVYLAQGWLEGHLDLNRQPPNENDWARVEVFNLRDGRVVKGQYGRAGGPADRFYPLAGKSFTVPEEDIASRHWVRYVSFPPLPAAVMLPFVALTGLQFNDVLFTVLWAALNPVLLFGLLESLRRRGHSTRSPTENLWMTVAFGAGSVYWYSSVIGQVWYTAHVVGVTCSVAYAWAAIDAARPAWAGLFLGLGFATRTPMVFMFPLFVFEAVRTSGGWARLRADRLPSRDLLKKLARFALPAGAVIGVLLLHNFLRFQQWGEFGHKYLNIVWQDRIQRFGLFNYHFLSRNLSAALVLLPRILPSAPYVKISVHGMSLLVTSPFLIYLLRPAHRHALAPALWLTVLATALPSLLYQNSGYVQFGYRFSLDYMVLFVVLLAVGARPLSRVWKSLIVVAMVVNLFGALTFDRSAQFTYDDSFFPHGNN